MSKKLFGILGILVLLALVVTACGGGAAKLSDQIIGKWQYEDPDLGETMTFDFQADGKIVLSAADVELSGTYSWVDDDTIELVLSFAGEQAEAVTADLAITGDTLAMTIEGETENLTRVK